jgi:hypothetical protein
MGRSFLVNLKHHESWKRVDNSSHSKLLCSHSSLQLEASATVLSLFSPILVNFIIFCLDDTECIPVQQVSIKATFGSWLQHISTGLKWRLSSSGLSHLQPWDAAIKRYKSSPAPHWPHASRKIIDGNSQEMLAHVGVVSHHQYIYILIIYIYIYW